MTWQAGCSPPSKVAGRYQDGRLQAPVGRRPRQGPPGGPTRSSPLAFIHVLCYFYHLYFVFAFLFIFCLSFMELWYCISWQLGRARREALHEVPTWHVFTSYTVTTSMCRLSKACLCVALFFSNVACPSSFLSCHRYLAVSHFTYVRYHYFVFAFLPSTLCFFLFPSVRVCIKLNVMGMFSSFAHRASL